MSKTQERKEYVPYFRRPVTKYRRCKCGAIISDPNNCWECGKPYIAKAEA